MNSPNPLNDLTGQTLRDYTLLRRLGRGGMADVYLARQISLERNVALKILKPDLAKDESYVKRFHREAQSAAALVQANIVQIFEVGESDGLHFIAQEYVHGRNLRQYLDRHGAVEPVMAINVLRQCALALQKASDFHVVHRDIKPENIMLSTAGEVKVTDFGLARINNDSSRQALTQIGITMGTPLYMSPEQVEGRSLDSRSDIYSLGVTAYHTLAGQPPFDGENALAIALQQVQEKAVPLTELRPDTPPELCQLIHRMMSKDPADRPQDPAGLLKELRKIKIDVDDDWELVVGKLALTESNLSPHASTLSQSNLAATQALQSIMKGNIRSWWKRTSVIGSLAALSLAALLLGFVAADRTVPESPLNVGPAEVAKIPRQPTIKEQYDAAYWGNFAADPHDEQKKADFWLAVIDYFPLSQAKGTNISTWNTYHFLARARLGEVYLTYQNYPAALEVYQILEDSSKASEHFQVMGSAGKAIAYDRRKAETFAGGVEEQTQKVRECLAKVGGKTDQLNQFMREKIKQIFKRYPASPGADSIP